MRSWQCSAVAVAAAAFLPIVFTSSAFAVDPTPSASLSFKEAPIDKPVSSSAPPASISSAPTQTPQNTEPASQSSKPPENAPDSAPSIPVRSPDLAKTGGQRDIWLTGSSLLCIWLGTAVVTYARERSKNASMQVCALR